VPSIAEIRRNDAYRSRHFEAARSLGRGRVERLDRLAPGLFVRVNDTCQATPSFTSYGDTQYYEVSRTGRWALM
jgi:hypothetical protein